MLRLLAILALGALPGLGVVESPRLPDVSHLELVFEDTFDEPSFWSEQTDPKGRRWRTKYDHSGSWPLSRGLGMNGGDKDGESEIYVDPGYLGLGLDPFEVKGGLLHITARPASLATRAAVRAAQTPWPPHPVPRFVSGMISSEASGRLLYGYVEVRLRTPAVVGAWPQVWLVGAPGRVQEIDLLEQPGADPDAYTFGMHWAGPDGVAHAAGGTARVAGFSRRFHTIGALWTQGEVRYYRDGRLIGRLPNLGLDAPMHLVINLAMDGEVNARRGAHAAPDAVATMDVDSVKMYALGSSVGRVGRP